uniref:Uncharacterized protein n=1 Tax=Melopsittacus undulatus TaxID=13146 RepID=A0A8C6JN67_MELUD
GRRTRGITPAVDDSCPPPLLPGCDCGPPPAMTYSRPSSDKHTISFPIGSSVMYTCIEGTIKIPGRSDTVKCLPGARWSTLFPCLPGSCTAPTRLRFAALSKVDERINFFPIGSNVSYVCRPGYENTSGSFPTSTCLENLEWSEAAELCRRKSCGDPGALPGGRMITLTDLRFGISVLVFTSLWLFGSLLSLSFRWTQETFCISLLLKLLAMLMLTFFPAVITCSSPPHISNGKHDGEGVKTFAYNSTVTYSCDSGFQLVGNGSIRCTSMDKTTGVWSRAVPACKVLLPRVSWKGLTLNQDPCFLAEFAPLSHLSHFTPWFSFFQVPNIKASSWLRRRLQNGK